MQKICIVIPCYNEEQRFPKSEFLEFFHRSGNIHFCLVNDGSQDNTLEMLKEMQAGRSEKISVVNCEENSGKAEAVRKGFLFSVQWMPFDIVGYIDADFSTPLEELDNLLSLFETHRQADLVFGSRVKLFGSNIQRGAWRHYLGRIFSTVASVLVDLPVYDTQCGAKLFRSRIIPQLFERRFISPWLFDLEILFRFKNMFGKKKMQNAVIEVPLSQWIEKGDTRITLFHVLKVPLEMVRIYRMYGKHAGAAGSGIGSSAEFKG